MNSSIELLKSLLKIPSITPCNEEVFIFLKNELENNGFFCEIVQSTNGPNLYAEIGEGKTSIAFAGHVDVVPTNGNWKLNPFLGEIVENKIYGRGTVDMKGAVAAAICAGLKSYKTHNHKFTLLLSGDEEYSDNFGTIALLDYIRENNKNIDYVIVGEPTNPYHMGEMLKIGRRGSISFELKIEGIQGHVAYPENALNPTYIAADLIKELKNIELDEGTKEFIPSNLEVTNIKTNNNSKNIIPGECYIYFNIRYNVLHDENSLILLIGQAIRKLIGNAKFELNFNNSAKPFICHNQFLIEKTVEAIKETCNNNPIISTTGGTSDARFIQEFFPVIEYGLISKLAHHVDEEIEVKDIANLEDTYLKIFQKLAQH